MLLEAFLILAVAIYFLHLREAQRYNHIPGYSQFLPVLPWRIPFFNPIPSAGGGRFQSDYLIPFLLEVGKKHNTKVVKVTSFLWTKLLVWGPEEVKLITKEYKLFTKGDFRKRVGMLGPNVLASEAEEWKRHRQIVNTAFSLENLSFLSNTTNDTMSMVLKKLEEKKSPEGCIEVSNVEDVISQAVMNIMVKSLFNADCGGVSGSEGASELVHQLDQFISAVRYRFILGDIVDSKALAPLLKSYHKKISEFKATLYKMMNDRREKKGELRKDLMATLLEANNNYHQAEADAQQADTEMTHMENLFQTLSDAELLSNAYIFFLAGNDSTTAAVQWLIYCIAKYPEVQAKMIQEISEHLGTTTTPDYENVQQLKYCQQVLLENLRHNPPFLFGNRCAELDDKTDYFYLTTDANGTKRNKVYKGTTILVPYQATHFDSEVWESPYAFKPERFEVMNKIKPTQFMSFGAGPRKCVGFNFTLKQQMIMIVRLLQRYTIQLHPSCQEVSVDSSRPGKKPANLQVQLLSRKTAV